MPFDPACPTRRAAPPLILFGLSLFLAALAAPPGASGQSVLTRTPNLSAGWVGEPGVVQFNFLHRFSKAGSKVLNTPTFLLAAPLPGRTLLGGHYASNSGVAREVNEFELLGRWAPLLAADGAPLDAAVTGAFNETAGSADGELSVGVPAGPLSVVAVGRAFSEGVGENDAVWAVGGGAVLRVSPGVSLAADVLTLPDRVEAEKIAWGAGLQLRIPTTPHTFSLQATNTRTATLRGSALGRDDTLWGFEFTIPFTLSRYLGGGGGSASPPARDREPDGTTRVGMTNRLTFEAGVVRIRAGETVTWENGSALIHTVTADPERATEEESVSLPEGARAFDSGDIAPGETFSHTFRVPGEYVYFCVPHEAAGMVGRVIVEP